MEAWQRDYIVTHRHALINLTRCSTNLLSLIRPHGMLDSDDLDLLDTIRHKDGERKQCDKFYDILSTRTGAYKILVLKLYETRQTGAGKLLLEGYRKNGKPIPFDQNKPPFTLDPANPELAILSKIVYVQGNAVTLMDFLNKSRTDSISKLLSNHLDRGTRNQIMTQESDVVLVPEKIPASINSQLYISRSLVRRIRLARDVLGAKCSDIFVISGISRSELSKLVCPNITSTSEQQLMRSEPDVNVRFICLEGNHNSDFDRICRKAKEKNVHLLDWVNNGLNWRRTFGYVNILKHYIDDNQETMNQGSFIKYMQDNKSSHICLSGTAGMGKSTFLQTLATKQKKTFKERLIFYFGLQEFLLPLAAESTDVTQETVKHLIASQSTNCPFGYHVLLHILNSTDEQFDLYFDGFDEILQSQIELADKLFKTITTDIPNIRLVVATRPHMFEHLENLLGVFGFNIAPLEEDDQVRLLVRFWKTKKQNGSVNPRRLKEYAIECIKAAKVDNKENKSNTGEPLQCTFLGEINSENAYRHHSAGSKKLVKISSKFEMFQQLIDQRMKRIPAEVSENAAPKPCYKSWAQTVKEVHILAAFDLLFPHFTPQVNQLLQVNYKHFLTSREILALGILEPDASSSSGVKFGHRTFAEFLLAEFLVDVMVNEEHKDVWNGEFGKSFLKFLCEDVLSNNIHTEHVLQLSIGNISPGTHMWSFVNEELNYFLNEQLIKRNWTYLKHMTVAFEKSDEEDSQPSIHPLFSSCVKTSLKKVSDLVLHVSGQTSNPTEIHFPIDTFIGAAKYSNQDFNMYLHQLLENSDINTELDAQSNQINPLQMAVSRGNFDVFDVVRKTFPVKKAQFLLHFCLAGSHFDDRQTIKDKIQIIKILTDKYVDIDERLEDGRSPLLQSFVHIELIEHLLEQGANVNAVSNNGDTLLHKFLERGVETKIEKHTLGRMLARLKRNKFNRFADRPNSQTRPLLCLTLQNAQVGAQTLRYFADGGVDFSVKNENNENYLFRAVEQFQEVECLEALTNVGHLSAAAVNDMGETVLHLAAKVGNYDAVLFFVGDELQRNSHSLINSIDRNGNSALHIAFSRKSQSHEMIQDLLIKQAPGLLTKTNFDLKPPIEYGLVFGHGVTVTAERMQYLETASGIDLLGMAPKLIQAITANKSLNGELGRTDPELQMLLHVLSQSISMDSFKFSISSLRVIGTSKSLAEILHEDEIDRLLLQIMHPSKMNIFLSTWVLVSKRTNVSFLKSVPVPPDVYLPSRFVLKQRHSSDAKENVDISEDQLIQDVSSNNSMDFCVIYSSFIGLTSILSSLASKIHTLPKNVVAYLDVGEFASRNDVSTITDARRGVLEYIAESKIAYEIINIILDRQNTSLQLFVDGIGEIHTEQIPEIQRFLLRAKQQFSNATFYVASRPDMPVDVGDSKRTAIYDVRPFTSSDYIEFLVQLWRYKWPYTNTTNLKAIATENLRQLANILGDEKELIATHIIVQNFIMTRYHKMYRFDTTPQEIETFKRSSVEVYIPFIRRFIREKLRDSSNNDENNYIWHAVSNMFPAIQLPFLETTNRASIAAAVSTSLNVRTGRTHEFLRRVVEEYCVAEIFAQLLHGRNIFPEDMQQNVPLTKSIYTSILHTRSHIDGERFNSLNLKNPVREIKSFVNIGTINMINCRMNCNSSTKFDQDAIRRFVDCVEPQHLYETLLACLYQDFRNITVAILNILSSMSANQRLGYKFYLGESGNYFKLILASTLYSTFDMTVSLCNFFTSVLKFDWQQVLPKIPRKYLTIWHITAMKGDLQMFEHFRPDNLRLLNDRGILHACVTGSSNDSWNRIKGKSRIIKLLTSEHKQLANEVWNKHPPLHCTNVHVELVKTMHAGGADITGTNAVTKNNIVHAAATYMPADQFHELVLYIINTCKEHKLFTFTNINGKTATHQALISVPNLKLATLQAILDIPTIDLYSITRREENSIFFEDTSKQSREVERYLHERGMEYFQLKKESDFLLDIVAKAGNGNVVSSLIRSDTSTSFGYPGSGNTLLHLSAIFHSPQEFENHVRYFLELGRKAAFNLKNKDDYTPLHLALIHMDVTVDTLRIVRDAGINIWTVTNTGVTILETAEKHSRSNQLLEALKEIEDGFNCRKIEEVDENWLDDENMKVEEELMEIWQKELMTKILVLRTVDIRCDAKLLTTLETKGVLEEDELDRIKSSTDNQRKLNLINEIIKQKPTSHFFKLARALLDSHNETASKILMDGVPLSKFFEMKLDVMGIYRRLRELLQEEEMTGIMARLKASLTATQYIDLCDLALSPNKRTKLVHDTIPKYGQNYIPRLLSNRVQINPKFFKLKCTDVFVFTGINLNELAELANPFTCDVSSNQMLQISSRFIFLEHKDDWNDIRSNTRTAVHLVKYEVDSKAYILEETFGFSKHLTQFTSHSEENVNRFKTEDQLLDEVKRTNSSAVLICDSSGNGKSTLLASLASKTSRRYSNKIVGFIHLPHFLSRFTSYSMETKANTYITKKLLLDYICPTPLGQEVLDALLVGGKIHMEFFFDGFDAVIPVFQVPAKWILTTLAVGFPNTRIYVTSTPNHKHELESSLRVIAYDIAPFSRENQIQFLAAYWREKDGLSNPVKLKTLSSFCLDNMNNLLNRNGYNQTATPIELRIMGEVYTNVSREYSQSLHEEKPEDLFQFETSILELYQRYMNLHLAKFEEPTKLQTKGMIRMIESATRIVEAVVGDHSCASETRDVKNFHIWTALKLILPEISDLFLRDFEVDKNMSAFKYLRYGILLQQSIGSQESVQFTHRILAEYIVAEFFARMITDDCHYSDIPPNFREIGFKFLLEHVLSTKLTRQSFTINQETILNDCSLPLYIFKYSGVVRFLNIILENQPLHLLEAVSRLQGVFANLISPEKLYEILNACCSTNNAHIFSVIKKVISSVKSSSLQVHKTYILAKEPDSNWEHHSRALSLVYLATKYSNLTLVEDVFHLFKKIFKHNLVDICEVIPEEYVTPLHAAVITGDISMAKYFVKKITLENRGLIHACVEYSQSDNSETISHKLEICRFLLSKNKHLLYKKNSKGHETDGILTSKRIHLDLTMFLIREGANIYSTDNTGNSIAFTAATYLSPTDYHLLVNFLIMQCKADGLFKPGKSCHSHPLHEILRRAKTLQADTFQLIRIASGINLNDCDDKGNNLLLCAVEQKMSLEFIQRIVALGGDYAAKNNNGRGVLHLAAETGNKSVFRYFVGMGILVDEVDNEGKVPLFLAAHNLEMIQYLLEEGVDIYNTDRYGNTIIHLSALLMPKVVWIQLLNYFVTNHKQVLVDFLNQSNSDGLTPLQVRLYSEEALDETSLEIILNLPDIDLNAEDVKGNNLLLLAVSRNLDVKLLTILVEHGAEYTHVNKKGESALHLAAKEASVENVKYIGSLGVDVDQMDAQGSTALDVAAGLLRRYAMYNFQDKIKIIQEIIHYLQQKHGDDSSV